MIRDSKFQTIKINLIYKIKLLKTFYNVRLYRNHAQPFSSYSIILNHTQSYSVNRYIIKRSHSKTQSKLLELIKSRKIIHLI